jgi:multidrug resistance efflux pump
VPEQSSPPTLGFPPTRKNGIEDVPPSGLGFPRQAAAPAAVRPTPLPQRPKGRWFVSALVLGCFTFGVYHVWNSFFRYRAYGTVTGRTVQLSPSWDGVIRYVHVREGESVQQGQLLLSLDNITLRQRCAQLGDELQVAQATLEAEVSKLKWQTVSSLDQGKGAVAYYYEALGNLLQEQANLEYMDNSLQRARSMQLQRAISDEQIDQLRCNRKGQEAKIAKLKEGLADLKKRADQTEIWTRKAAPERDGLAELGKDQFKPTLARIAALQAERARIQEQLDHGNIRAPTNGLVTKIHRFAGEQAKGSEPVLSMLEDGSLQVVLYLPQDASALLEVNEEIAVILEACPEPLVCTATRLGDQCEPAPEQIKRHYAQGQKLLPVYLEPKDKVAPWMALRVESVVKLPYAIPGFFKGPHR